MLTKTPLRAIRGGVFVVISNCLEGWVIRFQRESLRMFIDKVFLSNCVMDLLEV